MEIFDDDGGPYFFSTGFFHSAYGNPIGVCAGRLRLLLASSPPSLRHEAGDDFASCLRSEAMPPAVVDACDGRLTGEARCEVKEPRGHTDGQRNRGKRQDRTLSGVGGGHDLCSWIWRAHQFTEYAMDSAPLPAAV